MSRMPATPTVAEVLAMARRPVVSSHGGVQATCKANRNLTDDEIRGVAKTGGVIGIGYWDGAICSTSPQAVARADRPCPRSGRHRPCRAWLRFRRRDHDRVRREPGRAVTQALLERGFSEADIRKVMGGNVLRVLRAGLAPS